MKLNETWRNGSGNVCPSYNILCLEFQTFELCWTCVGFIDSVNLHCRPPPWSARGSGRSEVLHESPRHVLNRTDECIWINVSWLANALQLLFLLLIHELINRKSLHNF